ncbi:hypothetical protein OHB41_51290 [Streptomyces sp. NBC_01571]|uniref:hypothetical protein n=1 Tax=Streptomyces sp. NBC_01571 TaxID=2975883 RepID=UPI002251C259|nr:hypothetical protein [Streptomyces sp. NBC_01571]MCX4581344.1 hypothetical protein [Streptomyces sp. NBC_01571]
MNAVVFWALRAVAMVAIVVEVAALVAGEPLVLNLAAVLGLGAVAVTWVLQQDEVDR